MLKRPLSAP